MSGYLQDELLVKFKPSLPEDEHFDRLVSYGLVPIKKNSAIMAYRSKVDPTELDAIKEKIENDPDVEYVTVNHIMVHSSAAAPNDPFFGSQWHLEIMEMLSAWGKFQGTTEVLVAVVDFPVFASHEDLQGRLVSGWNFINNSSNTDNWPGGTDFRLGHGTWVSGCICANTNNSLGVSGVSPIAKVMPLVVFAEDLSGDTTGFGDAITYAADHGCSIINVSGGAEFSVPYLANAVAYAASRGCVLVGAAGNANSYIEYYPAAYPTSISVSATDQHDGKAWFSNFGTSVDVAAPGVGIVTTNKWGGYEAVDGTSFSCPITSGVASMVWSTLSGMFADTPAEGSPTRAAVVRAVIISSVDRVSACGERNASRTARLNANKAITLTNRILAGEPAPIVMIAHLGKENIYNYSQDFEILVVGEGAITLKFYYDEVLTSTETGCGPHILNTAWTEYGTHVVLKIKVTDGLGRETISIHNLHHVRDDAPDQKALFLEEQKAFGSSVSLRLLGFSGRYVDPVSVMALYNSEGALLLREDVQRVECLGGTVNPIGMAPSLTTTSLTVGNAPVSTYMVTGTTTITGGSNVPVHVNLLGDGFFQINSRGWRSLPDTAQVGDVIQATVMSPATQPNTSTTAQLVVGAAAVPIKIATPLAFPSTFEVDDEGWITQHGYTASWDNGIDIVPYGMRTAEVCRSGIAGYVIRIGAWSWLDDDYYDVKASLPAWMIKTVNQTVPITLSLYMKATHPACKGAVALDGVAPSYTLLSVTDWTQFTIAIPAGVRTLRIWVDSPGILSGPLVYVDDLVAL